MSKPVATVIAISIHRDTENPLFGEGATHMRLEDESAGGFFVISQEGKAEIALDPDDLYLIAEEGRKMMEAYDAITKS